MFYLRVTPSLLPTPQVGGGDPHAATLCWICASNVDAAVQQWSSALDDGGSTVNALQARQAVVVAVIIAS